MTSFHYRPKRAVYTALIGNYDCLQPVRFKSSIPFVVFTDIPNLNVQGWTTWQVSDLPHAPQDVPDWAMNRYLKMHPHAILTGYDETLYVDANISLLRDPSPLFDKYLTDAEIAIPPHMDRQNVDTELEECLRVGKINQDDFEVMAARVSMYKSLGVPHRPFTENSVILRSNTPTVVSAMELWWGEVVGGMKRDQLSLPYALHMAGLDVALVREGPRRSGTYMTIWPHWPHGRRKNFRYYARAISARRHRSASHLLTARIIDYLVRIHSIRPKRQPGHSQND